ACRRREAPFAELPVPNEDLAQGVLVLQPRPEVELDGDVAGEPVGDQVVQKLGEGEDSILVDGQMRVPALARIVRQMDVLDLVAVGAVDLADVEARNGGVAGVQNQVGEPFEVLETLARMEPDPALSPQPDG